MPSLVGFLLILLIILSKANFASETLRLDLTDPTPQSYSAFLVSVREDVRDPSISYGGTDIPVIGPPKNKFLRIDLILSSGVVSLAVSCNDLYVMGYMAMNEREVYVSRTLLGKMTEPQVLNLFPEVSPKNRMEIREYEEDYNSITQFSGSRKQVGLGVHKLRQWAEKVNKKERDLRSEARFMLLSIEMVAECSRFKYIEDCVLSDFLNGITPEDKVFVLVNRWGDISREVKKSNKGVFDPPLILTTIWAVNDVKELKMGLLKFCPEEDERGKRKNRVSITAKLAEQQFNRDRGRNKQNLCDGGLGFVLTKNNGKKGGHSRCVCSFSTKLAVIVPSKTLVAQESTFLDVGWYYLVVRAGYGASGLFFFLVHKAYRGQSKFSCNKVAVVCALVEAIGRMLYELQHQRARRKAKRNMRHSKTPTTSVVQQLMQTCEEVFASGEAGDVPSPDDVERLRQVLECMKPEDFGLTQDMLCFRKIEMKGVPPIRYLHIYACDKFLIGICCLPPSGVIPLHHHPGMTVLRKLLLGSMHIKSYEWATDAPNNTMENLSPSQMVALQPPAGRLAKIHTDAVFTGPCNTSMFYPAAGKKVHCFTAVTYCAMLDIFMPCHNDAHCIYYREIPFARNLGDEIHPMANAPGNEKFAWLEEREKPEEFFVLGRL